MRKTVAIIVVISFCLTSLGPFGLPETSSNGQLLAAGEPMQDTGYGVYFSPEQLDNLVAPIALYPDPLLAQVLLASTFVDQIPDAAQWVAANNDPNWIDSQPWDVSVKAVAHYPSVLYMMRDRIDWTASLGQAYVYQSTDVMMAVQRLRHMARSAGYLVTSPQQQVIVDGAYVRIVPYQPQYIYVPAYDPAVVYYRRPAGAVVAAAVISFGAGLLIGAWLNHDCDWHHHRVYYHGWEGSGWIARSRPNIHVTNIYVNNSYQNVHINRTVVNRKVDYRNLNQFSSVHREVKYDTVTRHQGGRPVAQPQTNSAVQRSEGKRGPGPATHRTEQIQTRPQANAAVTPKGQTRANVNTRQEPKKEAHPQTPAPNTMKSTDHASTRAHASSKSPENAHAKAAKESKGKSGSKKNKSESKGHADSGEKKKN